MSDGKQRVLDLQISYSYMSSGSVGTISVIGPRRLPTCHEVRRSSEDENDKNKAETYRYFTQGKPSSHFAAKICRLRLHVKIQEAPLLGANSGFAVHCFPWGKTMWRMRSGKTAVLHPLSFLPRVSNADMHASDDAARLNPCLRVLPKGVSRFVFAASA